METEVENSSDRFEQYNQIADSIVNDVGQLTNGSPQYNSTISVGNNNGETAIFINDPSASIKAKHSQRYSWNLDSEEMVYQKENQQSLEVQKEIVYATPFWEIGYPASNESREAPKPEVYKESPNKYPIFNEPTFACDQSKQSNLSDDKEEEYNTSSKKNIMENFESTNDFRKNKLEKFDQQEEEIYKEIDQINEAYDRIKKTAYYSKQIVNGSFEEQEDPVNYYNLSQELSQEKPSEKQSEELWESSQDEKNMSSISQSESPKDMYNNKNESSNFVTKIHLSTLQNTRMSNKEGFDIKMVQEKLLKNNKLHFEDNKNSQNKLSSFYNNRSSIIKSKNIFNQFLENKNKSISNNWRNQREEFDYCKFINKN